MGRNETLEFRYGPFLLENFFLIFIIIRFHSNNRVWFLILFFASLNSVSLEPSYSFSRYLFALVQSAIDLLSGYKYIPTYNVPCHVKRDIFLYSHITVLRVCRVLDDRLVWLANTLSAYNEGLENT